MLFPFWQGNFSAYDPDYQARFVTPSPHAVLPVISAYLNESCLGACTFCASCKTPNGLQMPWSLYITALTSPQLVPDHLNMVFFGDGEVLLFKDPEQGKNLLDAIEFTVKQLGRRVGFTTAGSLPQNHDPGEKVLAGLPEVLKGVPPGAVRVGLTISLLDPWRRKNVNEYFDRMIWTFRMLKLAGCDVTFYHVFSRFDSEANEQVGRLLRALRSSYAFDWQGQQVAPAGRALQHSFFNQDFEFESCTRSHCLFVNDPDKSRFSPSFGIRPNGEIVLECSGFGNSSTSFGNVYVNDARQVHEAFQAFPKELKRRFKEVAQQRMSKCEAHRTWKKDFGIKVVSSNPIIQRSVAPRVILGCS